MSHQNSITQNLTSNIISINKLTKNSNKLNINPASSTIQEKLLAEEHDAQPIKNMDDIVRIKDFLLNNKKYRDYMLFIVGINTGLRCSDLRGLRFIDVIDESCNFREHIVVFEQKTRNTRKVKKNRYIAVNEAIKEAITVYLSNVNDVKLDDYMFTSQSTNTLSDKSKSKPISRQAIQNMLVNVTKELNIPLRAGTHMLRKTFSYHTIMLAQDRARALELLQKILGHSNITTTLLYAGLTSDEISNAYATLNLGFMGLNDNNNNNNNNNSEYGSNSNIIDLAIGI